MSGRVIYFPYINVAPSEWLTRAVLYWDSIALIHPRNYTPAQYRNRPADQTRWARRHRSARFQQQRLAFTERLLEVGLAEGVDPEEVVYKNPRFADEFLALVDADDRIPRDGFTAGQATPVFVHRGKLRMRLLSELADRGLALDQQSGFWCPVESRTAALFMAYLASTLAASHRMTPITDDQDSLHAYGDLASRELAHYETREIALEDVLPAPAMREIEISDVVTFKERYGDDLKRFRSHVEQRLDPIAKIADPDERRACALDLQTLLRDEVDELTGRLRDRWPTIRHATLAILSACAPVGASAIAGDSLAAAAALPSIGLAAKEVRAAFEATNLEGEPLAYAAYAQKEFA